MQNLLEQATVIRDESQQGMNTAERVGRLLVEIVQGLGQTLTSDNVTVLATNTGVEIVFSIPGSDGEQGTVTRIPIPVLNAETSGVVTPSFISQLRQELSTLVSTERNERIEAIGNITTLLASAGNVANNALEAAGTAQEGVNALTTRVENLEQSSTTLSEAIGNVNTALESTNTNVGNNKTAIEGLNTSFAEFVSATNKEKEDALEQTARRTFINANRALQVSTPITFVEAINIVPEQEGIVITYLSTEGWVTYQYVGGDPQNQENWVPFGNGSAVGNVFNVTNEIPLKKGFYYDLSTAITATLEVGKEAEGLIISFAINEKQWKTYQFVGDIDEFSDVSSWQDFGSLSAGTEEVVCINNLCGAPDAGSYYSLETAIAKLLRFQEVNQVVYAKPGLIISYRIGATQMECKQFCGTEEHIAKTAADGLTFGSVELWKDFGGGGSVATIFLGDTPLEANEKGEVLIPMDNSMSDDSTNLLPNNVIKKAIDEVQNNTVFSVDVDTETSESEALVKFFSKNDQTTPFVEFAVPRGGGGGMVDTSKGQISITSALDKSVLKLSDSLWLTWNYDHLTDGLRDGVSANINITVNIGTATVFTTTVREVTPGTTGKVDLTPYIQAGTLEVRVVPTVTFEDGTTQTKRSYCSAQIKEFNISCDHLLNEGLHNGGYLDGEIIKYNVRITGSGPRMLHMYLDGATEPTHSLAVSGGAVTKTFSIKASDLQPGRHTVQFVAESEGLLSDSIYCNFLRAGGNGKYVGIMYSDKTGRILVGEEIHTPILTAVQYEELRFFYTAYNPVEEPTAVTETIISEEKTSRRTLSVRRSHTAYVNRFTGQGENTMTLTCGADTLTMQINVEASGVELNEYTANLDLKLSAMGRSNQELAEEREQWSWDNIHTSFEGFDWKTNGWVQDSEDGDALKLTNGAKAVIDYRPFAQDVKATGATIELEFKVSNVSARDGEVITCIEPLTGDAKRGFHITGQTAAYYTGGTTEEVDPENVDSDGNPLRSIVPIAVQSRFVEDKRIKVAFVIGKNVDKQRTIEIYIDGIRSGAMSFSSTEIMKQDAPQQIVLSSDTADLYVYAIRSYTTNLGEDDLVANYIVDRPTVNEMFAVYEDNAVLNEAEGVDMRKLISMGKGVIHVVRAGDGGGNGSGVDDINACTDKDQNFDADHLFFYTPWGWVFRVDHCRMRIQGTSSTKYPVKNHRYYIAKSNDDVKPTVWVDRKDGKGFVPWEYGLTIPLMENDPYPSQVLCAKCDFSDSSMSTNTGMARVYTDVFRIVAPTPPQKVDSSLRMAIHGYPVDIFASRTIDDANPLYCGQYNINNDKSDWATPTGMKLKAEGIDEDRKMSLEFLNNSTKLGNWQVDSDIEAQMQAEYDDALEFNYPKDLYWTEANALKEEGDVADDARKDAIKRLWGWVKSCVPSGANYNNISSFKSQKFADELSQYFDVANICCWYLFTDYNGCVDQRVKNMILRTWDGLVWYFTYYDGDCMFGKRNDSKLKYEYNMNRDTWDAEKNKYAFEGHDSVLWCLLLANCEDLLKTYAQQLREVMTNDKVLGVLNDEQVGNWSARLYNRSGAYKYMRPELEGTLVNRNGVVKLEYAYYMYALNGAAVMHRNHFILNRYALLDAKYGLSKWTSDQIDAYVSNEYGNSYRQTSITITSGDEYYYGWGTNNNPKIQTSPCVLNDATTTLTFSKELSMNDPIRIYGASRIKELDLVHSCAVFAGQMNLSQCKMLRKLDVHAVSANKGASPSLQFNLNGCSQLRVINVNGQKAVSTAGSSNAMDLSSQGLLQVLDAGGTNLANVVFAEGAPITQLVMPATITTLSLKYHKELTQQNLTLEGTVNIQSLTIEGCPAINASDIVKQCASVRYVRLVADKFTGDASELLSMISRNVGGIDEAGTSIGSPVVEGAYELTQILEESDMEAINNRIAGITLVLIIDAYINLIDDVNGEAYGGAEEVDTVTLENIGEHLYYYNGETYDEYLADYARQEMNINDYIDYVA